MTASAPSLKKRQEALLAQALIRAARFLGLTQAEAGKVIGRDRTSLHRGIEPESKAGELAALLIRCYRSLYVLMGGDPKLMKHWMHTLNHGTGGVPAEQIMNVPGLIRILEYLDAMRAKV